MKKALLIDGNAILYKSYYASSFLLDKGQGLDENGNAINALRTFAMIMIKVREIWSDYNVLVAFDAKDTNTYRTKHSFYKANRSKAPEELNRQRPLIKEFLELFGFKWTEDNRFEADDIIGILSKQYSKNDIKVDILTADKDLLQLVNENVRVFISKTGVSEMVEHNNDNFRELNDGLTPNQIKDLKGIMGDSSDNLPGIKGIGSKGAIKLLMEYGNLEEIIANRYRLSESMSRKIEQSENMAILCKEIATIMEEGDILIPFDSISTLNVEVMKLVRFLNLNSIYKVADRIKEKWL